MAATYRCPATRVFPTSQRHQPEVPEAEELGLDDEGGVDVPTQLTVYADTDCEGEPEVKAAHELWPKVGGPRSSTRRNRKPAGGNTTSSMNTSPLPSGSLAAELHGAIGTPHRDAGVTLSHACAGSPAHAPTGARASSPNGRSHHTRTVTTLMVRNLPLRVTQLGFLREVDQSGFIGAYDFAYLPPGRVAGQGAGHAFVNFKGPELAHTFQAAWHTSTRLGMGPGDRTLSVVPALVQGFVANAGKWRSARSVAAGSDATLPFISQASDAAQEDHHTQTGGTTLVVQNLPAAVNQQRFLDEVNSSGFVGTYDFAYLPLNRDTGRGQGHAFLNFRTAEAADSFKAAWHSSNRLGAGFEGTALNVARASVQGFRANTAKWSVDRVAHVKNPDLLPFIIGHSRRASAPAPWQ